MKGIGNMKIAELNGYEIHIPISGGKAGRGGNVTSSIQVRLNHQIIRSFRFNLFGGSHERAIRRAKEFILNQQKGS